MKRGGTVPATLMVLGLTLGLTGVVVGFAGAGWKQEFHPSSALRALIGCGLALSLVSTYLVRRESKRARRREGEFLRELKNIADDLTLPDAEDQLEDLCLLYDEEQRKHILDRLGRMPRGQRKLNVVLREMDREG